MPSDGPPGDEVLDVEEPEEPEQPEPLVGLNVRVLAPTVGAVTNVTALVGPDLEPQRCHIYIRDGVIAAIVPAMAETTPLALAPPSERDLLERSKPVTIDGEDMIAIPGLIDAHAQMRALAPGLPAPAAATADPSAAAAARMGPEEYELTALLGSLQRLKCGVTTVVDHAYPFHEPELDEACVNGYESSGIRWVYARGIMTRPLTPACETFEQAADRIRALLANTAATPERLFVAPVGIAHAAPEEFARAAALAAELGAGTYTRAAETPAERAAWIREVRAKPVVALERAGFLSDRTVLVHGVFLDDDEIKILAARGAHIVHCPSHHMSHNLRLSAAARAADPADPAGRAASRPGPADPGQPDLPGLPDLLAAGVNVALGVDTMPDLFSAMRAALHVHSLGSGGPAALSPRDVLRMATGRGAAAVFPEAAVVPEAAVPADHPGPASVAPRVRIGELSPQHAADIVLIPARSLLQAPLLDPLHAVVHRTQGPMVRHVLVEGQLVVADGVSTLVDEDELVLEAERACNYWLDQLDLPAGPGGVWFPPPRLEGW